MTQRGCFIWVVALVAALSLQALGCGYQAGGGDAGGGGATAEWWSRNVSRVETSQFPKRPGGWLGPGDLYGYFDPQDPSHFANIFRWPRAHTTLAIYLHAISSGGSYGGDEIGIYELTDTNNIEGMRLRIDGSDASRMDGFKPGWGFLVSFSHKGNDTFITIADYARNSVSISLNALYRWRVYSAKEEVKIGEKNFKMLIQGGNRNAWTYFSDNITGVVLDPAASRSDLRPLYVVQIPLDNESREGMQLPIGDTGYVLRYEKDNFWHYRLAR